MARKRDDAFYLCKAQIQRMLNETEEVANEVYQRSALIDEQELGYRINKRKVRKKSVLKAYGITEQELEQQKSPVCQLDK